MSTPQELIAGPLYVWVADGMQNHPEISLANADIPAPWTELGSAISEDGVTFSRAETVERRKTLDSPQTKKFFRSEYDVELSFNLEDMSIATLARIENGAAVTVQAAGAGTGGYREYVGGRNFDIKLYSLLIRGTSPADNDLNLQMLARCAHIMAGDTGPFDKTDVGTDVTVYLAEDNTLTPPGYYTWREQHQAAA